MSSLATENLADLIDKRHRCLLQLRDLGRKQAELIASGQMGPLIRLIGAKNQLIAALQSVEQGLAPFHAQNPDDRLWPSTEARDRCAEQADASQQLLSELMELERQNEQNIVERRDKVASQLQAAQAAGTARGAYQAHQMSTPQGPHTVQNNSPTPMTGDLHGHHLDLHSDA
ncbi:MAG: hypothetical protein ACR2NM_11470 [Bythopirellula sp.]